MAIRVLNTFKINSGDAEQLAAISSHLEFIHQPMSRDEVEQLDDPRLEVLLATRLPGQPTKTPRLRWLQTAGGGLAQLQPPPGGLQAWARGVVVTNGRGAYALSVGAWVMWALLDHYQRGATRRKFQQERMWPTPAEEEPVLGRRLRGQTVLIVGYGSVGRQVSWHARNFGMRVLAIKATPTVSAIGTFCLPGTGDPNGEIPARVGDLASLPTLAAEADIMVVTLPLTGQTRAVINARVLASMPEHSLLIVAGRGGTVDMNAVTDALASQAIGGAVMDGMPSEPLLPSDPLWDHPRLVITPHIAGGVAGDPIGHDWDPFLQLLLANLRRYVYDEPLLNVVDLERGY